MPPARPKLRSFADRCRQIALFELFGLLLITPPFAWASGTPLAESAVLMALLALIAALWNGAYNTAFDWLDGRLSGRTADRRPTRWRVVHALGFELGMLTLTLPVLMWWTGMSWLEALIADLVLAGTYVVYAFVFNLCYDRVFPIDPNHRDAATCTGET
ncbi:MAG TPA: PACE efflux transporter [Rhodocyclaceae bacterium]|nr:PACE efflux transporter [Rhodocyclaceae bacterium]